MESTRVVTGSDCNTNGKNSAPWSFDTNWLIAHGSLQASVTVDSSDYPIDEPDLGTPASNSPLVLKPPLPDSGPCEIKICFDKKYDISQIYVRSTARVYEVYYAHSPHSNHEYLCTVKCGIAERDRIILQTSCLEDVGEEHSEHLSSEIIEESAADGETNIYSEDEWVKIKVPLVERNSCHYRVNINRVENVQDLYEATAQTSDTDPCSVLKIRLLSLQDKSNVYVDEIYVFVDPVESTDPGNETVLTGSSIQSSVMSMFVPTLLQLSKLGACQVQEKHASIEGFKDNETDATGTLFKGDKRENVTKRNDESDVFSEINRVNQQYMNPKELEKDILEEPVTEYVEPVDIKDPPPGRIERALGQLISRVSRVEGICLRFEENLMKPIESIEARLQKVEEQLQKLTDNTNHHALPRGTRICAPTFSYNESTSSSLHAEQSEFPASEASEFENKDLLCNSMPKLPHNANFHPSLIVSAPEFPCEEDERDFEAAKESLHVEPKKAVSVDDALADALNRLLSSANIHPSDNGQAASSFSGKVDEGNNQEHSGSVTTEAQEMSSAENFIGDSLSPGEGFTFRAPVFMEEKRSNEDYLNYTQTTFDTASKIKNDELDCGHIDKNMRTHDFDSESLIGRPVAFEEYMVHGDVERDSDLCSIETCVDAKPDLDKDSVGGEKNRINGNYNETNPRKSADLNPEDDGLILKQDLGQAPESISEDPEKHNLVPNVSVTSSSSCVLDFEFPILEVKFTSDMSAIAKTPLEALLGGAKESDAQVLFVDDGNFERFDGGFFNVNETTDLFPIKDYLIDTGVSSTADSLLGSDGEYDSLCAPSGQEMNVSLI